MKILQINASARREGANSTRVANRVVERLLAANPGATVTLRDLAAEPLPVLDEVALGALFTPADQRSAEQAALAARFDAAIDELKSHDVIVLGVAMYNFGVTVQLKGWIDAIARAGVTFKYTETGPVGLVTGKTVYAACARGGLYRGTPNDSQTPYLKSVLGFMGLTDVRFVYAEGLNMGPDATAQGFAQAEADLEAALA
ncbi:FMN-dependent NADH-azoreductase [Sphaerotilus microaerophilus]|jgi:FMN-dependent NADH-azoreductase|uniref:FMN dependent NADH:quinone oxidoreductase n=1 Tax=Sphaerotilus microaerophilus TaxID=2914710 RepID=A0ABN6PHQ2_9BURK|nr:NAD(P)H-dependent oxidoreductase [Sphaerotilus sp. FB-5]BDI03812.1 FMN-dependent NADH-azoreductase [Sphaerotilus sp. FB-5]